VSLAQRQTHREANVQSILIIGAGQAGGRAAQTLREQGFGGRLLLAGDESLRPYERPPLSKGVLTAADSASCFDAWLHPLAFYDEQRIEWLHDGVVGLDLTERVARLASGADVRYDRCLFTTGGRARRLPELAGRRNVVTLRTLPDALRLRERLAEARRVAVLGGGFLGLEFAASARARGLDVTVVEAGDALLGRALPAHFAARLRVKHESHGVSFKMRAALLGCAEHASGVTLQFAEGPPLDADLCVVAIGQQPNDELAKLAGLQTGNGIHVDVCCRTSAPDVYAAGDCANFPLDASGRRVRLESWQNAQDQAIVAARNMLGDALEYQPTPWFWTDQYDWNIQMLGMPDGPVDAWVERPGAQDKTLLMGLRNGVIVQALAVNSGGDLRAIRRLVEQALPVDTRALADPAIKLRQLEPLVHSDRI
jgi:3-phenylpropionate/trans-cinnamate dioxygenase ferredoxin reductase subunit